MDKIICLVGASGSGKTTLAKELEGKGYNIIHSYTTRQKREPGEWGHRFLELLEVQDEMSYLKFHNLWIPKSEMIAYFEEYNHIYFATREQYQGKGTSIYIIDPGGAKQVKDNVKDAEVITIFLNVNDNIRLDRMLEDGREHKDILLRFLKDQILFKDVKCDYEIDGNNSLFHVLWNVIEIIK